MFSYLSSNGFCLMYPPFIVDCYDAQDHHRWCADSSSEQHRLLMEIWKAVFYYSEVGLL